eukprot:876732-Alexandrium_andersonii.AAC.1
MTEKDPRRSRRGERFGEPAGTKDSGAETDKYREGKGRQRQTPARSPSQAVGVASRGSSRDAVSSAPACAARQLLHSAR